MKDTSIKNELIGCWVISPDDINSRETLGDVMIKFGKDGILTYTIFEEQKEQVIVLIYVVIQNEITTIQPGRSHEVMEVTKFLIEDNILQLTFNGFRSKFIRLP